MASLLDGPARRPWVAAGLALVLVATSACDPATTTDAGARPDRPAVGPPPPTNVMAVAGDGMATLSWEASVAADEYHVYYATEPGVTAAGYMDLAGSGTVTAARSPIDIPGLENGSTHYFVVTGVLRGRESAESVEVSATPRGILVVSALYETEGARWTHQVANDGPTPFTGTGAVCPGTTLDPEGCLHAGEMRGATLNEISSCDGVTAQDSLDAFEWECVPGTPTRIASRRLRPGRFLRDLIDLETMTWRSMGLEVRVNDVPAAATDSDTVWWDNPIAPLPDLGSMDTEDTIFVVAASRIVHVTVFADNTALTMPDDVTLRCNPLEDEVVYAVGHNQLWFEGNMSGENVCDYVINADNVFRSNFHNLEIADNAPTGPERACLRANGGGNYITNLRAEGCDFLSVDVSGGSAHIEHIEIARGAAVRLQSNSNTVRDLYAYGGPTAALSILEDRNRITGARISNMDAIGIFFDRTASYNALTDVVVAGGEDRGIRFSQGSDNIVVASTVSNLLGSAIRADGTGNASDPVPDRTLNQLFVGVAAVNVDNGLHLEGAEGFAVFDTVVAPNRAAGLVINNGLSNVFSGMLGVGQSPLCAISGGTMPGLIDGTCDNGSGAFPGQLSDATFSGSVDASASFVGRVSADDSVNAEASAVVAADTINDFTGFENRHRVWGPSNDSLTEPLADGLRGRCASGETCQIWDWSLNSADTALRGVLSVPTGNDTYRHTWSATSPSDCNAVPGGSWTGSACVTDFLAHAVEILLDDDGNDNGLCESNETCLYTPNVGAYQGHGDRIEMGSIGSGGTIENVTLMRYATNGR